MKRDKEFLSVADIADVFDVHHSTVYRWIRLDLGPRVTRTPGGRIRVRWDDFLAWVDNSNTN